jgi:hypothetical protein
MVRADEDTHKADDEGADSSIPRRVRLETGREWQGLAVDSLGLHASIETGIRVRDTEPGHETRDGRHLREPVEHFARSRVDAHERQERESRGDDERHYGQSIAKRLFEYRRCVSGNREAVYDVMLSRWQCTR